MNRRDFLSMGVCSAAGMAMAAGNTAAPAKKSTFRLKESIKDVAGLAFGVGRGGRDGVLEQFKRATAPLEGTGLDLLVTCEGMESAQLVTDAESPEHPGRLLPLYQEFAKRNHCTVAGSIKLASEGRVYNALEFIGPDGKCLGDYRKNFLTKREYEKGISAGPRATVTNTPAGKLGGVICFDMNFDELRDQYTALQPDILCFSSMYNAGIPVLTNWALRTYSFLVTSVKDLPCAIVDPLGHVLDTCNAYKGVVRARVNIDRFVLHHDGHREKLNDIRRAYGDAVRIDYDSEVAAAVLYSLSPEITAEEIAREYDLLSFEAYMKEARTLRKNNLS